MISSNKHNATDDLFADIPEASTLKKKKEAEPDPVLIEAVKEFKNILPWLQKNPKSPVVVYSMNPSIPSHPVFGIQEKIDKEACEIETKLQNSFSTRGYGIRKVKFSLPKASYFDPQYDGYKFEVYITE
ncbi:MAG: hypothetical protein MUO21_01925 [Nitrososphaeraceae archaeon]|nr:hypothetical protein [Nitrososphaeraceae archaeon]